MPLFGLPYGDEEEERRRRMLTPPLNPNAPNPLPAPAAPSGRMLPASSGIPGGEVTRMPGPVGPRPLTRAEQLAEERHVYQAGTPTRGRSALRGAFEGLASGGLGGAITGAIYGAADPAGLRRRRFEKEEKPRLLEQFAMEDADAERQRRDQTFGLDTELKQAQIGATNRSNIPRPVAPPRPIVVPEGGTVLDPTTGRPVFTSPRAQKPPTDAELTIDPESGMSAEEMADASYQGRGGDDYVRSKLPARTRQILEQGTVTSTVQTVRDGEVIPAGTTRQAGTAEREAAQKELEGAIRRQRDLDLQYTRGAIRGKRVSGGARQKQGGGKAQRGAGVTRSRSEFNSSKFPGLKFD